jgi:rfaE bifunctional protein nucleotidyltransferase chain/domain
LTTPSSKITTLDELVAERRQWREQNLRMVLANGAFDMLHVGHLRYLEGARHHGDRLVVAVNSDLSVRRYKGPDRPIVPEHERVEILSHLWLTDRLFLFDEPNLERVLDLLRPEVHAKGTDYTVETVPEREVVKAYGGETVICGDPKDHATSDVISTIVERFGNRRG